MKATIFNIKHFAIHDGPGIRQTIFFKGCPLQCWWCHNPESHNTQIEVVKREEVLNDKTFFTKETIGDDYSLQELIKIIKKDMIFFEESGGGVTLSGGEPLLQHEFANEILKQCQKLDIHTCVDTCGFASRKIIENVSSYTDLFLYDIKHIDDVMHKKITGVSNKIILENLKYLDKIGKDIWIRYPLIPGLNSDESELLRLIDFLSKLKHKYPLYILPYHKIGSQKYHRLGMKYNMDDITEPDDELINKVTNLFSDAGMKVNIGG